MSAQSTSKYGRPCKPGNEDFSSPLDRIDHLFFERHDATRRRPVRAPSTIADYRKTLGQLIWQVGLPSDVDAKDRLRCTVAWFSEQARRWKKSVIRHHRACLLWAVEHLARAGELEFGDVQALIVALDQPLEPRVDAGPRRTSADKRKDLSVDEHVRLVRYFASGRTKTSRLLAGMLGWGIHIGLRPCEYQHARICGFQLVVRGAKTTNGRGLEDRLIDLVDFDEPLRYAFAGFLDHFQAAADASDSWDVFQQRLAKALSRACQKLNIPQVSLYTIRHQALANVKCWLASREIAAFAGHVSPATASRNYARQRGGWGTSILCRPAAKSVSRVAATPVRKPKAPPSAPRPLS